MDKVAFIPKSSSYEEKNISMQILLNAKAHERRKMRTIPKYKTALSKLVLE